MRARTGLSTDTHADGNVDVEKTVDKNRNDDFVDSSGGTMKKKKSVSSFSDDDATFSDVAFFFRYRARRVSRDFSET